MAETTEKEVVSLNEPNSTAQVETPEQAKAATESSGSEGPAPSSTKQKQEGHPTSVLGEARTQSYSLAGDFAEFVMRTKRVWLGAAGAIAALLVAGNGVGRLLDWARNSRERRHEQAIASVTPERLIARCGQPAQDATKEVYPVLMRTVIYEPKHDAKVVFTFSRTAEEQSDWVFLSMADEGGARTYDTPEAKVAAMSCLDSKK